MVASFRTREGGFRYRISLPYRRSLFFTPHATEKASRTPESLFEHRMRIPYRRRPSPVLNAANGRKEKSIACSECHNCQKRRDQCKKRSPGCRREQENHSQKVCNTAPNLLNISRKSRCRQNPLNATPKKLLSAPGIFADCYRLSLPTPRGWVVVAGCKDLPIQTPNDSHKGLSFIFGAENGTRTRDLNLGKVALYQLSYFRNITPYLAVGITKVRSFFKFANYF